MVRSLSVCTDAMFWAAAAVEVAADAAHYCGPGVLHANDHR
jgi:hypothetical protein